MVENTARSHCSIGRGAPVNARHPSRLTKGAMNTSAATLRISSNCPTE